MFITKHSLFKKNKNRTYISSHIYLSFLISFLFLAISITQETTPTQNSVQNPHIETVSPKKGETKDNHFMVWETECLSHPYEELVHVVGSSGEVVDKGKTSSSITGNLENFEKLIINQKMFTKINIEPFLDRISEKKSMGLTEYNNKGYIGFMIFMLVLVISLILVISLFTCTKLQKKILKPRSCCIKTCLIFIVIFMIILFALLILALVWSPRMMGIQKDLVCEATRLPHTLFYGSPEIHYKLEGEHKFLGMERIRELIYQFLGQYENFITGKDATILKEIKDLDIQTDINKVLSSSLKFKDDYKEKKVLNSEGVQAIPISISHSLPLYTIFLDGMIDRYELTSRRVDNLNILQPMMDNEASADAYKFDLENTMKEIEDIELHLASFWNDVMRSTFDPAIGFKLAVIGLIIIFFLLFISLITTFIVLCKKTKDGKIEGKSKVRFLMILNLVLMLFGFIAVFGVNRATFSTFYGCATMHQFKENPEQSKALIEKKLLKDPKILSIFQNCYFEPQPSGSINFYNLFINNKSKNSLEIFMSFMDALKSVHEEVKGIKGEEDMYHTQIFEKKLQAFKDGLSYDFADVFRNLSSLNSNYNCSPIAYSLTSKACLYVAQNKAKCISIVDGSFESDDCMGTTKTTASNELFQRLQDHIRAEQIHIDTIMESLSGSTNHDSISNTMSQAIDKFDLISKKIEDLDSDLGISFNDLASGHLDEWLDCRAIKKDVDTIFERLCGHYVYQLAQFGDVAFFYLLLMFISILMIFIITFCVREKPVYRNEFKTEENLEGSDSDEQNYLQHDTDAVIMKDNTQDNTFDQFGTFKQMGQGEGLTQNNKNNVISKVRNEGVQEQRLVGASDKEFNFSEESDDEDIFNNNNDYAFKK